MPNTSLTDDAFLVQCYAFSSFPAFHVLRVSLAWFSHVGKIPDDRGFYFLPTIPDFADISDIHRGLSQIFERRYVSM